LTAVSAGFKAQELIGLRVRFKLGPAGRWCGHSGLAVVAQGGR